MSTTSTITSTYYPLHGIRLSTLKTWFIEHVEPTTNKLKTITTGEFVYTIVIPITQTRKCALIDLFQKEDRVDKATVFVSHAWGNRFLDTLDTVDRNFMDENKDIFVWIDAVVVNQHETKNTSPEFYSSMFHAAIHSIGHTMAIFSPFDNPLPLRRSWCLWELLGTIQGDNTKLTIAFPERERLLMLETMKKNSKSLLNSLCVIDARNAHAQFEIDEIRIRDAIQSSVGFERVNDAVLTPLREWLLKTAGDELTRVLEHQQSNNNNSNNDDEVAEMYNLLGLLHYDLGRLPDAIQSFTKALEIRQGITTTTNSALLAELQLSDSLTNLASAFIDNGQVQDALSMYSRALTIRKNNVKSTPIDIANTYNNIGLALKNLGQFQESLQSFNNALELITNQSIFNETYANILVNRGELFRAMGKPNEAIQELNNALEMKEKLFGSEHVSVAQICNLTGQAYFDLKDFIHAEQYFQRALQIRSKALGPYHQKVGLVLLNLAKIDIANGRKDEAKERLLILLKGQQQQFGELHEFTLATMEELKKLDRVQEPEEEEEDESEDEKHLLFREISAIMPQHGRFDMDDDNNELESSPVPPPPPQQQIITSSVNTTTHRILFNATNVAVSMDLPRNTMDDDNIVLPVDEITTTTKRPVTIHNNPNKKKCILQ
jgi:tetratricopeptide (TPR) repeat protein